MPAHTYAGVGSARSPSSSQCICYTDLNDRDPIMKIPTKQLKYISRKRIIGLNKRNILITVAITTILIKHTVFICIKAWLI